MTYIMEPGDPYHPDVYSLARMASPCDCESWVPIAVEIPVGGPPMRFDVEFPRELGTYCVRCQSRSIVTVYDRDLVYIPDQAMNRLYATIPSDHISSWEITPRLMNKSNWLMHKEQVAYVHLLYCRTCRKVYKVALSDDISVKRSVKMC